MHPTPLVLKIANIDISKVNIPLDKFEYEVESSQSYEQQALLYQQILKQLKDAGLTEKYETQDKLFQELKLLHNNHPILNFISKNWWDYGYDKGRIFFNSFAFFLIFFVLNIIFFKQLKTVYFPVKFISKTSEKLGQRYNPRPIIAIFYQLPGIFLYTAFLFWGLKLDLKEIEIKKNGAIILIICQYLLGVICLAYLANYVISK